MSASLSERCVARNDRACLSSTSVRVGPGTGRAAWCQTPAWMWSQHMKGCPSRKPTSARTLGLDDGAGRPAAPGVRKRALPTATAPPAEWSPSGCSMDAQDGIVTSEHSDWLLPHAHRPSLAHAPVNAVGDPGTAAPTGRVPAVRSASPHQASGPPVLCVAVEGMVRLARCPRVRTATDRHRVAAETLPRALGAHKWEGEARSLQHPGSGEVVQVPEVKLRNRTDVPLSTAPKTVHLTSP